ncbi:hypothetical protein B0I35DRAFT_513858 [Stachybotrys elegans]|uniref:PD-(D/E)XK nuclease-like domain-containing protein n=1 Tax=Stachybotrys elegans TaxID=80388 RepID=A0A8K0SMQ0_9HYPO|nr:hypothetical protein B0I35DRAFT_513858 [Stachybotrys elegans]
MADWYTKRWFSDSNNPSQASSTSRSSTPPTDDMEIASEQPRKRRRRSASAAMPTATPEFRIANLQGLIFAENRFDIMYPNDLHLTQDTKSLVTGIVHTCHSRSYLPKSITSDFLGTNPADYELYDPENNPWACTPIDAGYEITRVEEIMHETWRARFFNEGEPHWAALHYQIIQLALGPFSEQLRCSVVSQVPIAPECRIPLRNRGALSTTVDITVALSSDSIRDAARRRLADDDPSGSRSINHTNAGSLLHSPIALSIVSQSPQGEEAEAKVQLAVWVAAQLERLRVLSSSKNSYPLYIPTIRATGCHWKIGLVRDTEEGVEVTPEWHNIAVTFTPNEYFKVIGCLRHLARWAIDVCQPSLFDNGVLKTREA